MPKRWKRKIICFINSGMHILIYLHMKHIIEKNRKIEKAVQQLQNGLIITYT